MDHDRTRALYAPLITKPALTDQLLNRPPFKFIMDVLANTVAKTGFLKVGSCPFMLELGLFYEQYNGRFSVA